MLRLIFESEHALLPRLGRPLADRELSIGIMMQTIVFCGDGKRAAPT